VAKYQIVMETARGCEGYGSVGSNLKLPEPRELVNVPRVTLLSRVHETEIVTSVVLSTMLSMRGLIIEPSGSS
jgi:hypothetical protein